MKIYLIFVFLNLTQIGNCFRRKSLLVVTEEEEDMMGYPCTVFALTGERENCFWTIIISFDTILHYNFFNIAQNLCSLIFKVGFWGGERKWCVEYCERQLLHHGLWRIPFARVNLALLKDRGLSMEWLLCLAQ